MFKDFQILFWPQKQMIATLQSSERELKHQRQQLEKEHELAKLQNDKRKLKYKLQQEQKIATLQIEKREMQYQLQLQQLAHEQMVGMLQNEKRELENDKAKLEDSVERLSREAKESCKPQIATEAFQQRVTALEIEVNQHNTELSELRAERFASEMALQELEQQRVQVFVF